MSYYSDGPRMYILSLKAGLQYLEERRNEAVASDIGKLDPRGYQSLKGGANI
jgi:hypothetical protein